MNRLLPGLITTIAGIIIIIAMRPLRRLNVSTENMTVSVSEGPGTLVSSLSYKGWFAFSFAYVGGTLTVPVRQTVFTVTPLTNTTTAASPDCYFTVTGISPGTGTFSVSGTSANGSHGSRLINVNVVA